VKIFRPENNGVHLRRDCRDFPGLLIEWIDNFKIAAFDPVHEPGHVKSRYIGAPGSRNDNLGVQGSKSQVSGFGCQVSTTPNLTPDT
jgi:hypothetical protein